jgi:hypothetical protein
LVGDKAEQFLLDCIGDLDESGALSHDVCLLDPAASSDVVADGRPLSLLDHQVLPTFVEDTRNGLLLLQLLDAFDDFFGGEFELVGKVLEQTQLGLLEYCR